MRDFINNLIRKIKNNVILSWLLSYIVVFVFAVAVMLGVYTYIYQVVYGQSRQLNMYMLSQTAATADTVAADLQRASSSVLFSDNLQQVVSTPLNLTERSNYYSLHKLGEGLKAAINAEKSVSNGYLYLKKYDLIVSDKGIMSSDIYYKTFLQSEEIPYEQWMGIMLGASGGKYVHMQYQVTETRIGDCIAFIQGFPNVVNVDKSAVIVMLADYEQFGIAAASEETNRLMILDSRSDCVFGDRALSQSIPECRDEVGFEQNHIDGKRYFISYISSKTAPWKYVLFSSANEYNKSLSDIRLLFAMAILVVLFGEMWISRYFLKKNYTPVQNLMRQLGFEKHDKKQKGNEYEFMEKAIHQILSDKLRLEKVFDIENEIIRNNCITGLLEGKANDVSDLKRLFETVGIRMISEEFTVIIIQTENVEELFAEVGDIDIAEKRKTSRFIVKNVLEELFGSRHLGFVLGMEEESVCLVNLADGIFDKQEFLKILTEAQLFFRENFGLRVSCYVSQSHNGSAGINLCYFEAHDVMKYRDSFGGGAIVLHGEVMRAMELGAHLDETALNKLVNCISVADEENGCRCLPQATCHDTEVKYLLFYMLHYTLCKLFQTVPYNISAFSKVLYSETPQEAQAAAESAVKALCAVQRSKQNGSEMLYEKICEYVNQNYGDVNLSIGTIGEALDMDGKLLSRKFKEYSGVRLIDYINRIRIDKVKEILRSQDINLQIASSIVGFASLRTFMRVFKECEGITPGSFKESLRKQK